MNIERLSIQEFKARLKEQGVSSRRHYAFKCVMCQRVQSMQSLISADAGANEDDVERYLGFSCVGRFTGAGSPRKEPDGKPCNWTLGGLIKLHCFEIIDDNGVEHPRFEPATAKEAQALERSFMSGVAA